MAGDDALFERGDVQFFHKKDTKDALIDLATHDEVVLYCGAGVTIDRTGLGWKELVSLSLRPKADEQPYILETDLQRLSAALEPQRLASILRSHCRQRYPDPKEEEGWIVGSLRRELYERNTWRGGRLVDALARYAAYLARVGKRITIVTSNYDTYIEQAIADEIGRLKKIKKPRPGFQVEAVGRRGSIRHSHPSDESLETVKLVYLHGRVPLKSGATGRIVLDEVDYAESRQGTVDTLRSLLNVDGVGAMIVGGSLTDPPLIEALALTRERASSRYVIMPVTSTQLSDNPASDVPRLLKHFGDRCDLLGVKLLVPDFKVQIAQFFEELVLCCGLVDPSDYKDKSGISYGKRLVRWWEDWVAVSANGPYVADTYGRMRGLSSSLRARLDLPDESADDAELLKIEIWARWDPAKHRALALWGSSLGVLAARSLLRKAELVLDSGQASARCFTEGRPQYVDLDEVQPPKRTSRKHPYPVRWKSFLSVPIYLERPERRLIVGVVTLASSKGKESSAIPRSQTAEMQTLVNELTGLGTTVLDDVGPS